MSYRRIVFDLDGTLIDSAPDLHRAANILLSEAGAAPLSLAEVREFIGNGIQKLVERAAAARGLDGSPERVARYHAIYGAAPLMLTRPYPGVAAALDALAAGGAALSIATNKPEAPTRAILAELGWAARFDIVVGGDTLPVRKPDPAPLRAAMDGARAGDVLYVGDSEVDADTAAAAGVDFALFTEGYRKSPVEALAWRYRFSAFAALPELAAGGS